MNEICVWEIIILRQCGIVSDREPGLGIGENIMRTGKYHGIQNKTKARQLVIKSEC